MPTLTTVNSGNFSFGNSSLIRSASALSAVQVRALIGVQFQLVLMLSVLLHVGLTRHMVMNVTISNQLAFPGRDSSSVVVPFRPIDALRSSALFVQDCRQKASCSCVRTNPSGHPFTRSQASSNGFIGLAELQDTTHRDLHDFTCRCSACVWISWLDASS